MPAKNKLSDREAMEKHDQDPHPARYVGRCVAVYGTLRRGGSNDITQLVPEPEFVGTCVVAGTMFHLGRYPGVVLGGKSQVACEVYRVSPALEQRLDEIESEYPAQADEYAKREQVMRVSSPTNVLDLPCFIYEINPSFVQGCPVIASGDWILG